MAIVQISKIIHRTGSVSELPQLDIGEIGFASDEQRLFIGNDPAWVPPDGNQPTNTEILTNSANCRIDFSQVNFSSESLASVYGPAFIATITTGQTVPSSPDGISLMDLVYNNTTKNISNGYNASTGVFTAPKEGFYQVSACLAVGSSTGTIPSDLNNYWGGAILGLSRNDTPIAAGPFVEAKMRTFGSTTIAVADASSVSTLVYMNENDTLKCTLAYATNATFFTTYANIVQNYFQAVWIRP